MDPNVISELSRLDTIINQLVLNPLLDPNKLKEIQSDRQNLDRKFADFRTEMDNRSKSFSSSIHSEIERVIRKVSDYSRIMSRPQ